MASIGPFNIRFGYFTPEQMIANPQHWREFIIWHDINPVIASIPEELWSFLFTNAKLTEDSLEYLWQRINQSFRVQLFTQCPSAAFLQRHAHELSTDDVYNIMRFHEVSAAFIVQHSQNI